MADATNRNTASTGGDNAGQNLRTANYTNNALNQITSRSVPGFAQMIGSAAANATVTLWSDNGAPVTLLGNNGAYALTLRKGQYYWSELPVTNSVSAAWLTVTNLAVLQNGTNADTVSSTVGSVFLAQTPETFGYDLDGNMTNDGRWVLTWDAENRVTSFTSLASSPAASRKKVDCTYDYAGRRTQKIVSIWNGAAYVPQYTNRFLYDGWNLGAVFDGGNNLLQSFVWGTDLSGTTQGAGGVGGLLAIADYHAGTAGTYFPAYDGNGNVMALVSAADGSIAAQYEYGPFGELLRATGPMAKANPFRFSTKYQDDETDLVYYGYRYYNASTGRWNSRDPLEEAGALNLYLFAENAPIGKVDSDGREITETGSGGGPTGGVIRTRKTTGVTVKGLVVGTFQYPRRGYCGCWERNVYADFTPILTQHLQHYKYWTSYKDDFSLDADVLEALAELAHFLGPIGPDPAALGLAVESAWQRKLDTINFTVTTEYNAWDWGDISWSMSKTYYKNGQSVKISNTTCKPSLDMLDPEAIKALTDKLGYTFAHMPGPSREGPTTTTVTLN